MAISRRWRNKLFLAKIETTAGVDASPTAAADAMLAQDLSITVEADTITRNLDKSYFGADPELYTNKRTKISGKIELAGSGTAGTAPAWGPVLRACGMAETTTVGTSVAYSPVSSGFETVTVYLNIDGTQYKVLGCLGTGRLVANVGEFPMFEFELTGIFSVPTDVAITAGTYSAFQDPEVVKESNAVLSAFSTNLDGRTFAYDLGVQVQAYESTEQYLIEVADRQPSGSMGVWIPPTTTLDLNAKWDTHATGALQMSVNGGAGNIVTIDVVKAQLKAPQPADMNGVAGYNIDFIPLANAGNDEITLTLT